ncbi:hypothetical protein FHN55_04395 [Streptomyces sp. NP160]|uniref:DUF6049 family protein n=1 Tax=Streptomyces sp. NP160 TaxID=2586637 RepID=UPI001118B4CE|nr:DUF6049 family protein [Streptomyces sp. NP160]TNM69048.1 hypothetical protein FHN55_04395 [Streptomyces sp. NP160]
MVRAGGRASGQRLVVLLGAAAVALGPMGLAAPAAGAPAPVRGGPLTGLTTAVGPTGVGVDLEQLGPTALTPGSQLVVRVRVTNTSAAALTGARSRLFVDSPVLSSRAALDAWAAGQGVQGGDRFAGVDGAEQPLGRSLAPGESTDVDFSVDADQLQLGGEFGPRGITVDVLDSSLQRLTALRTFVVWLPQGGQGAAPATAPLTVVAPVTAGAPDVSTGQLPEARVEEQLGRLRDLLPAMSLQSTSLVVDPALLGPFAQPAQQEPSVSASGSTAGTPSGSPSGSASPGPPSSASSATGAATTPPAQGSDPTSTADPTSAGGTGDVPDLVAGTTEETSPDLQTWVDVLLARTGGRAAALPQGDTDVVATGAAGTSDLLALAVSQARTALGGDDDQVLLWPADLSAAAPQPLVTEAAAAAPSASASSSSDGAGSTPGPAVLVDARSVPGGVGANGTGPSTATLTTTTASGTASATGVLVDATASSLLASAAADGSPVDPAEASARLLADTAVSAVGGGGVVLALPRSWDADPSAMATVLGPVSSAPWVRATPLPDLLASAPTAAPLDVTQARAVAADQGTTGAPLSAAGLNAAQGAVAAAETVAPVVQDPAGQRELLEPVELSAAAAASLGWRDDPQGWQRALDQLSETAARLRDGLEVVQGSPTTVISSRVNLPVNVRNTLAQPATVFVHLQSGNIRLIPRDPVELTIAPGTQQQAQIPVRAAASGDTSVTVYLTDAAGNQIGEPEPLRVRVRADWEGRGVAIAAGVAGLVFVGGVVRTVVRVRRRPAPPVVRSAEEADADGPPTRRPEESTRG